MTKLSRKHLDPARFGHYINNLWSAFILMDSKEDVRLLFKDLFTHTEYKMFAKRLEIARRLLRNESYKNIQRDLQVTSHTVSRVNSILFEKGDGVRKANQKLNYVEEKYLSRQRKITKNLENPFLNKTQRKTVLGTALKVGLHQLDKTLSRKIKHNTAKRFLPE